MLKKTLLCLILFSFIACSNKVKPLNNMSHSQEIYAEGVKLVIANDYDKAIKYFSYILVEFKSIQDEKYYSLSLYQIGFCFYQQGYSKKSLSFFNKVINESKNRRAKVLANLAKAKIEKQIKS